jgi:hypothetical protein
MALILPNDGNSRVHAASRENRVENQGLVRENWIEVCLGGHALWWDLLFSPRAKKASRC